MPRKLRLEYPGAIYHVMSRANGKGNIFETDVDRQDFVKTLAETCAKTGFQIHAYCLMRNHFHLVVETPQGNLVAGMRWFLSAYTLRFNPLRIPINSDTCSGFIRTVIPILIGRLFRFYSDSHRS